jgi:hypothetical protein
VIRLGQLQGASFLRHGGCRLSHYRVRVANPVNDRRLTDVIRQVHVASRGTYGIRRVHADLILGQGVAVGHQAVEMLMRRAGIQGISGRPRFRNLPGMAKVADTLTLAAADAERVVNFSNRACSLILSAWAGQRIAHSWHATQGSA